jgi:magnesium-transporting ATPase (P-type)
MDAMQKRKALIVSILHFGLTLCVALIIEFRHGGFSGSKGGEFHPELAEQHIREAIWFQFWAVVLIVLQPLPIFIIVASQVVLHAIWLQPPMWLEAALTLALILLSVPFWSYSFGKIFVKLDNWLNHFPVLGKRVF